MASSRSTFPINRFLLSFTLLVLFLFQTANSYGEFYEYTDSKGVKTFTDNPATIPASNKDDIQIHKGRYDDLSEEERRKKIKAEEEKRKELKRQQEEMLRDFNLYQESRKKEEAKQQRGETSTPVKISNNMILVPVTIRYKNKQVQSTLILDTGANITVIYDTVAKQLKITTGIKASTEVAGGGILPIEYVEVKSIQVGPKIVDSPTITVMEYRGTKRFYDGLLGLDYLKKFKYEIDYEESLIIWKE